MISLYITTSRTCIYSLRNYSKRRDRNCCGLSCIVAENIKSPFDLFWQWKEEFKEYSSVISPMILSTAGNNQVSGRCMYVTEINKDGFMFMTDVHSKKHRHLEKNPIAAGTFLFFYIKDGYRIMRQICIEGCVERLNREVSETLFNRTFLCHKIRVLISKQGEKVDWCCLKSKQEKLCEKVKNKKCALSMPNTQVGYILKPRMFDFSFSVEHNIPDRIIFTKEQDDWVCDRVAA